MLVEFVDFFPLAETGKMEFTFVGDRLFVPIVIDAYEPANHLDVSRNIGSLPWLIMTFFGVLLVAVSCSERSIKRSAGVTRLLPILEKAHKILLTL